MQAFSGLARAALEPGASKAEIVETIGLAIYMGAGPSMIYGAETLLALKELGGQG